MCADPACTQPLYEPCFVDRKADNLVGRDAEVADVKASLQQHKAALLWGSAGIGKSSVAAEAALQLWEHREIRFVLRVEMTHEGKQQQLAHYATYPARFGSLCRPNMPHGLLTSRQHEAPHVGCAQACWTSKAGEQCRHSWGRRC